MRKETRDRGVNTPKAKERAVVLAKGINQVKKLGIVVIPNEPIEGKMFWQ